MADEKQFTVTVPMRTSQTFTVRAASSAGAKRKVQNWFKGRRDEGDDLWISDDIGQESFRVGSRYWEVTEA